MKIPLIKPYIDQNIKDKVIEVLDSGYLTEGLVTKEFESKFKDYIGCRHAITVTSATTGLEVALRALGICEGDEVIVPDYTHPATASVVPIVRAKAVIVDVNKTSMLIDYDEIEKAITTNTKAIIPVSGFGNPLDYEKLNAIKEKYNLFIIEDAACSIGAEYKSEKVGNQADITVFSLHPRKFITTGEGGVVITNNDDWANWINAYKNFGMDITGQSRESVHFGIIGTNYKLSNIQAAVGLVQLNNIHVLLNKRIALANNYKKLLKYLKGVNFPQTTENCKHSYQSFIIFVEKRDKIIRKMKEEGIEVQIGTYALHMHNAFNNNPLVEIVGNMKNSKWCYKHALTLPLFHELTNEQQRFIVKQLLRLIT